MTISPIIAQGEQFYRPDISFYQPGTAILAGLYTCLGPCHREEPGELLRSLAVEGIAHLKPDLTEGVALRACTTEFAVRSVIPATLKILAAAMADDKVFWEEGFVHV